MIYRPRHFKAFELVGPDLYARFGEDCFRYLRPELLEALDALWEGLNSVRPTVVLANDWKGGGRFRARGYRVGTDPEYKPGSAHSIGAAADLDPRGWTPREVLDFLQARRFGNPALQRIRRVEDPAATPTWFHLDVLEHDGPGLLIVRP